MRHDKDRSGWMALYHNALLELDLQKLAGRIPDAQAAIDQRRQELHEAQAGSAERQALLDASNNLAVLRKELPRHSIAGQVDHSHPGMQGEYVAIVNANRQYVAVTDGVCRLLGYDRAELITKTIDDVTAPPIAKEVPARFEEYVSRGFMEGEYLLLRRDGRQIPIRYEARIFPDGCFVARWQPLSTEIASDFEQEDKAS